MNRTLALALALALALLAAARAPAARAQRTTYGPQSTPWGSVGPTSVFENALQPMTSAARAAADDARRATAQVVAEFEHLAGTAAGKAADFMSATGSIYYAKGQVDVPAMYPWLKVGGQADMMAVDVPAITLIKSRVELRVTVSLLFADFSFFVAGNLQVRSHDERDFKVLLAAGVAELARGEAQKPAKYLCDAVNWGRFGPVVRRIRWLETERRASVRRALAAARDGKWTTADETDGTLLDYVTINTSVERHLAHLHKQYHEFASKVLRDAEQDLEARIAVVAEWDEEDQLRKFGGTIRPVQARSTLARAVDEAADALGRDTLASEYLLATKLLAHLAVPKEQRPSEAEMMALLERLVLDVAPELDGKVPPKGHEALILGTHPTASAERRETDVALAQRVRGLLEQRLAGSWSAETSPLAASGEGGPGRVVTYDMHGEVGLKAKAARKPTQVSVLPNLKAEASAAVAGIPFGLRGQTNLDNPVDSDNYRKSYSGYLLALEVTIGKLKAKVKGKVRNFEQEDGTIASDISVNGELIVKAGSSPKIASYAVLSSVAHAAAEVASSFSDAAAQAMLPEAGRRGEADAGGLLPTLAEKALTVLDNPGVMNAVNNIATHAAASAAVAGAASLSSAVKAQGKVGMLLFNSLKRNNWVPSARNANGGSALKRPAKLGILSFLYAQSEVSAGGKTPAMGIKLSGEASHGVVSPFVYNLPLTNVITA